MKRSAKIIVIVVPFFLLALALLAAKTQTSKLSPENDNVGADGSLSLPAKSADDSRIFDEYGKFAFETFQKHPAMVDQIRELDNSFASSQMDPSYPSRIYRSDNKNSYLLLGGCTEHNCDGTKIIVAYSLADKKVLMGKENGAMGQLSFFGDPSEQEKSIIGDFYLQK